MCVLRPLFLMRTITTLATLMPLTHYAIQLPGQVKHLFYAPLEPRATTATTILTPPPVCLAHPLAKPSTLKASLTLFFSMSVRSGPHCVCSFRIYRRPANYHSLPFPKFHSLANCLSHLFKGQSRLGMIPDSRTFRGLCWLSLVPVCWVLAKGREGELWTSSAKFLTVPTYLRSRELNVC